MSRLDLRHFASRPSFEVCVSDVRFSFRATRCTVSRYGSQCSVPSVQHEVAIPDSQRAQLASLPAEWTAFQAAIVDAGSSLEDAKENFREKVRGMVDTFGAEVAEVADTFAAAAPFTSEGVTTAQVRLASYAVWQRVNSAGLAIIQADH